MAEADYTVATTRLKNETYQKILTYGRDHKIFKREVVHGSARSEAVDTVNIAATLEDIVEAFFELTAQKVS